MPSNKFHRLLSLIVAGDDANDIHSHLDQPAKQLGYEHRIVRHDIIAEPLFMAIKTWWSGGDITDAKRAAFHSFIHIVMDKLQAEFQMIDEDKAIQIRQTVSKLLSSGKFKEVIKELDKYVVWRRKYYKDENGKTQRIIEPKYVILDKDEKEDEKEIIKDAKIINETETNINNNNNNSNKRWNKGFFEKFMDSKLKKR